MLQQVGFMIRQQFCFLKILECYMELCCSEGLTLMSAKFQTYQVLEQIVPNLLSQFEIANAKILKYRPLQQKL